MQGGEGGAWEREGGGWRGEGGREGGNQDVRGESHQSVSTATSQVTSM